MATRMAKYSNFDREFKLALDALPIEWHKQGI